MRQETVDQRINCCDGTLSEGLENIQGARFADGPGIFFPAEAASNPPRKASMICHNTGIHHVGLHATNPAASAEFYRDVLDMKIGGSAPDHPLGASAFLSSRPDEESHEVALFANHALAHIAFK